MNSIGYDYILELKNLEKRYGEVVAVNGISLDIRAGEFLTLLGPSGSGKTTVLLMIAGFEYPTSGEVMLQGKSINFKPPNERDIGMVFQNYALFPHMTIFNNIAFPLKMKKVNKLDIGKKVKDVLSLVQLRGYEVRYPKQLSGGQQQRIALARAVVFNPSLLLMDEPLGALDKKLREHMQLEIKHIQRELKVTVIYVTHDQEEALVMSDRIAIMNEGRIEQIGTPDEIYEKPINKFVAGFIGESNFIEGSVADRKDDRIILQMEDGSALSLHLDEDINVGEEVCLCIRPEKLFIAGEDYSSENILEGVVKEVIYVGETLRYKINIGKEKMINIREMSLRKSFRHKEGDGVKISWYPRDLRKL
jgi:spermidine/putrescine ABC transporter ATP-binding subunit